MAKTTTPRGGVPPRTRPARPVRRIVLAGAGHAQRRERVPTKGASLPKRLPKLRAESDTTAKPRAAGESRASIIPLGGKKNHEAGSKAICASSTVQIRPPQMKSLALSNRAFYSRHRPREILAPTGTISNHAPLKVSPVSSSPPWKDFSSHSFAHPSKSPAGRKLNEFVFVTTGKQRKQRVFLGASAVNFRAHFNRDTGSQRFRECRPFA